MAFGETEPTDALDALSRLHDTAYATYSDRKHREAADMIYNEEAKKLGERFPNLAGNIVLYGNYASRQAEKLSSDISSYWLLGPLVFQIENMMDATKMIDGTYLKSERQDILNLYATDPKLHRLKDNKVLMDQEAYAPVLAQERKVPAYRPIEIYDPLPLVNPVGKPGINTLWNQSANQNQDQDANYAWQRTRTRKRKRGRRGQYMDPGIGMGL